MSLATLLEAARFLEQQEEAPASEDIHMELEHGAATFGFREEEPARIILTAGRNGMSRVAASAPIAIPMGGGNPPLGLPAPPLSLATLEHADQPRARSNSNGSGGPRAGTREVHNKLEKNRRAHLKECFEFLKKQLPSSPDDKKSSNLSILDSAIRYIQVLRRREREYEHEMERLAREKISAQQRVAALCRDSPSAAALRIPHSSNHDREAFSEGEDAMASRVSPLMMASPASNTSLSGSLNSSSELGGGSPHSRLSPPAPPMPSSTLDLCTRPHQQYHNSNRTQILNIHTNGAALYSRIEQTPSPPHQSVQQNLQTSTAIPQRAQILGTFQATTNSHQTSVNQQIVNHQVSVLTNHQVSVGNQISTGRVTTPGTLNLTVSPALKAVRTHKLPTLTVTSVNQAMAGNAHDRKIITTVASAVNGQIVHPTQIHVPLAQMINGNGLVVSPIQLFSTQQTLRVFQGQGGALAPVDLPSTAANSPIQRLREVQKLGEAGVGTGGAGRPSDQHRPQHHIAIKPQPPTATIHAMNPQGSIAHMMNGLTPLVVSQGTHIITASPHLAGKMVTGPILKASVGQQLPMTVGGQYITATTLMEPVTVVTSSQGHLQPPHS